MQTFIDQNSPRCKIAFAELPRGVVKFPPQVVDAVARERAKFSPEIFTDAYARQSLEQQTLAWFYAGLPVAYKPLLERVKDSVRFGPGVVHVDDQLGLRPNQIEEPIFVLFEKTLQGPKKVIDRLQAHYLDWVAWNDFDGSSAGDSPAFSEGGPSRFQGLLQGLGPI